MADIISLYPAGSYRAIFYLNRDPDVCCGYVPNLSGGFLLICLPQAPLRSCNYTGLASLLGLGSHVVVVVADSLSFASRKSGTYSDWSQGTKSHR